MSLLLAALIALLVFLPFALAAEMLEGNSRKYGWPS